MTVFAVQSWIEVTMTLRINFEPAHYNRETKRAAEAALARPIGDATPRRGRRSRSACSTNNASARMSVCSTWGARRRDNAQIPR